MREWGSERVRMCVLCLWWERIVDRSAQSHCGFRGQLISLHNATFLSFNFNSFIHSHTLSLWRCGW
jgi:hypothetical protein